MPKKRQIDRAQDAAPFDRRASVYFLKLIEDIARAVSETSTVAPAIQTELRLKSPAEISNVKALKRAPAPELVLRMVEFLLDQGDRDPRLLDSAMIDGGLAPLINSRLKCEAEWQIEKNEGMPVLRKADHRRLPPWMSLLCNRGDWFLLADGDRFLLMEPIMGTDSEDTGTLYVNHDQTRASWERADGLVPYARTLAVIELPLMTRPPAVITKKPTRVVVDYSRFQDAALVEIARELKFFEAAGLVVETRDEDWYSRLEQTERGARRHKFDYQGKDGNAYHFTFTNIYSYVDILRRSPDPLTEFPPFLFPANIFKGYQIMAPPGLGATDEDSLSALKSAEITTVFESDMGAQLWGFAREHDFAIDASSESAIIAQDEVREPNSLRVHSISPGRVLNLDWFDLRASTFALGSLKHRQHWLRHGWRVHRDISKPYPINGFVGERRIFESDRGRDVLQAFIEVWFRTAQYVEAEIRINRPAAKDPLRTWTGLTLPSRMMERILDGELRCGSGDKNDVIAAWKLEEFIATPARLVETIRSRKHPEFGWQYDLNRAIDFLLFLDRRDKSVDAAARAVRLERVNELKGSLENFFPFEKTLRICGYGTSPVHHAEPRSGTRVPKRNKRARMPKR